MRKLNAFALGWAFTAACVCASAPSAHARRQQQGGASAPAPTSRTAPAQTIPVSATQSPTVQEADELFQKQDWAGAAKAYASVAEREPSNGRAWFRLGQTLHSTENFARAAEAFQKANETGFQPVGALFRASRSLARAGDRDKALAMLNRAVDAGFTLYRVINSDADLAPFRDDARFKETAMKAERAARPCVFQAEYKQFDFWVGEWDVTMMGQPAGTSSIQRIEDGCVIFENWTGVGGGTGKSFNFYDSGLRKWRQVWVSSNGGVLDFFGEYADGQMRYTGETQGPAGTKVLQRLTFFNLSPDRVRQFWEQSTDSGKTWTVSFDGLYVRKK